MGLTSEPFRVVLVIVRVYMLGIPERNIVEPDRNARGVEDFSEFIMKG